MIPSQNCICIISLKIDVMLIKRNQTKYFQKCHNAYMYLNEIIAIFVIIINNLLDDNQSINPIASNSLMQSHDQTVEIR